MNIEYFKYTDDIVMSVSLLEDSIEEEITENVFGTTSEGKIDYSNKLMRDVSDYNLDIMVRAVKGLIGYRKRTYDSSEVIKALFEKLPDDVRMELIETLNAEYNY